MRTAFLLPFALPLSLLLAPSPSFAQIDEQAPALRVRVSDLDLSSPAGEKELDRRIRRAAVDLCPPPTGTRIASAMCIEDAVLSARKSRDLVIAQSVAASMRTFPIRIVTDHG